MDSVDEVKLKLSFIHNHAYKASDLYIGCSDMYKAERIYDEHGNVIVDVPSDGNEICVGYFGMRSMMKSVYTSRYINFCANKHDIKYSFDVRERKMYRIDELLGATKLTDEISIVKYIGEADTGDESYDMILTRIRRYSSKCDYLVFNFLHENHNFIQLCMNGELTISNDKQHVLFIINNGRNKQLMLSTGRLVNEELQTELGFINPLKPSIKYKGKEYVYRIKIGGIDCCTVEGYLESVDSSLLNQEDLRMTLTFGEWLDRQCKARGKKRRDMREPFLFDVLETSSGMKLSVQASVYHYSDPRKNLYYNGYKAVEVYVGDNAIPELNEYMGNDRVCRDVPVDLMESICEREGGIKYFEYYAVLLSDMRRVLIKSSVVMNVDEANMFCRRTLGLGSNVKVLSLVKYIGEMNEDEEHGMLKIKEVYDGKYNV